MSVRVFSKNGYSGFKEVRINALSMQRGVVLFVALIMLVAMSIAAVSIVRSIDTSNVIAGNLAFKEAAVQVADVGVETAMAALPSIIATSLDTNKTSTSPGYQYYSTQRKVDANGVPYQQDTSSTGTTAINWSAVPIATSVNGYDVRIVIDRLCKGTGIITDINGKCIADQESGGGSHRSDGFVFTGSSLVYYRITSRASGPKNSVSIVQAVVGRGS
ncbi:MAG: pilus assembly protein PilX [Pseudomonadota bacterium]